MEFSTSAKRELGSLRPTAAFVLAPCASLLAFSFAWVQVMSVWPFKSAILRSGSKGSDKYQVPVSYLFHFGNTDDLRTVLFMTNRLTGCGREGGRGQCLPGVLSLGAAACESALATSVLGGG